MPTIMETKINYTKKWNNFLKGRSKMNFIVQRGTGLIGVFSRDHYPVAMFKDSIDLFKAIWEN